LPTFCAFAVPTLLPVVVRCFVEGTTVSIASGAAGLVGLGQALFAALSSSRLNQQAILARFENLALLDELGKQKELAEQARSRAEAASQEKSRFLAAASHDLRQPMHALRLFASAALGTHDEAERRRIVERVDASVASLSALFDALLEVSRLDSGAMKPELHTVSVRELLAELGAEMGESAREKGLTLRVRAVDAALRTDRVLLGRILRNLLSNAISYTERGGVLLAARRRGERLRLEVWDTGVGIPESLQAQVFEEFFQVGNPERDRRKGVGLGLSIVARLAALLGYRVELRSRVGQGSRFSLELPLGTDPASSKPVLTPLDESALLGALVVAIDDEPDILLALELVLKQSGALVVTAESATQALERLQALGRGPDVVISDYRLRDGETGAGAIRRLRAEYGAELPALIVTGDGAAEAGELTTLRKPVERDELERALVRLLS
jgi:signal transduction histidine kinase/CheY-like chemotaxis protein